LRGLLLRGGREREETVIKGRVRGKTERKGKERNRDQKEEEREGREGEEVCSRNFQLFEALPLGVTTVHKLS